MADDALSRRALLRLQLPTSARKARPDVAAVKAAVAERWERAGDALLRAWEPLAPVLCDIADVGEGMRLLDAATGDGNLALEAARRGAVVTACDLSRAQLERAEARAVNEGLDVTWIDADVEALPDPDGAYDVVLSALGAALAPRPRRTVRELLRVLRPAGRLVLAVPGPHTMTGHVLELAQEGPARLPRGVPSPSGWGVDDIALDRIFAVSPDTEVETRIHGLVLEFESEAAAWDAYSVPFGLPDAVRDRFADRVAMLSETTDRVRISEWLTLVLARRAGLDAGRGWGEPLS